MNIELHNKKHPPELAINWYLGQMLATSRYLKTFLKEHLNVNIDVNEAKIISEQSYGNKRIDLCIFITDSKNKKYGIVIESKVHWPDPPVSG